MDFTDLNRVRPLDAARVYALGGWAVFPAAGIVGGACGCRKRAGCDHPGKHPLCRGGLTAATTDPAQIRQWWSRWPWAGVAVATGARSGIVVVDVDPDHDGDRTLTELHRAGLALPDTLTARTGGGGRHLIYAHPDWPVRNTASRLLGAGDAPGIDVRGDGGYIIVAPSPHRSGRSYQWADNTPIAPCPTWVGPRPQPRRPPPTVTGDHTAAYARAALERETARVATAPTSTRNDTLNRAAFSLGTLVGAGLLDPGTVVAALEHAAAAVHLPEREAQRTIRSGLETGRNHPRPVARLTGDASTPCGSVDQDGRRIGQLVAAANPRLPSPRSSSHHDWPAAAGPVMEPPSVDLDPPELTR